MLEERRCWAGMVFLVFWVRCWQKGPPSKCVIWVTLFLDAERRIWLRNWITRLTIAWHQGFNLFFAGGIILNKKLISHKPQPHLHIAACASRRLSVLFFGLPVFCFTFWNLNCSQIEFRRVFACMWRFSWVSLLVSVFPSGKRR